MRLQPITPSGLPRTAPRGGGLLVVGDYVIPEGTGAQICSYARTCSAPYRPYAQQTLTAGGSPARPALLLAAPRGVLARALAAGRPRAR
jgi:hypothetical protein